VGHDEPWQWPYRINKEAGYLLIGEIVRHGKQHVSGHNGVFCPVAPIIGIYDRHTLSTDQTLHVRAERIHETNALKPDR